MKLELKHLVPYLPYKLKMISLNYYEGDDIPWEEWMLSSLSIVEDNEKLNEWWNEDGDNFYFDSSFKPLLKPFKDLKKSVLEDFNFIKSPIGGTPLMFYSYEFVEYCFKNHYDVFGLIQQGLAIDINTLK